VSQKAILTLVWWSEREIFKCKDFVDYQNYIILLTRLTYYFEQQHEVFQLLIDLEVSLLFSEFASEEGRVLRSILHTFWSRMVCIPWCLFLLLFLLSHQFDSFFENSIHHHVWLLLFWHGFNIWGWNYRKIWKVW
jgi:hypothetical protein